MRATIIPALLLVGCVSFSDEASRVGEEEGEDDTDECKIEGDDIGSDGVVLRLGSRTVTFHDWVSKDGEAGEYVGFSISVAGTDSVGYVVKASTDQYPSRATTWLHPAGAGGAGISNVDVCEECEGGTCDDGGGGDDGGGDGSGSGSGSGSDGPIL